MSQTHYDFSFSICLEVCPFLTYRYLSKNQGYLLKGIHNITEDMEFQGCTRIVRNNPKKTTL